MEKREKRVLLLAIHRTLREHTPRPQYPDMLSLEHGYSGPLTILCTCSDMEDYVGDTYREHLALKLFIAIDEIGEDY